MRRGSFDIGHTLTGLMFSGWSAAHVFFRPPEGGTRSVLSWGQSRDGWRCVSCGCIVFWGDEVKEPEKAPASVEVQEAGQTDAPAVETWHTPNEAVMAYEPVMCLNCNRTIPPRTETCPHCGWTWKG